MASENHFQAITAANETRESEKSLPQINLIKNEINNNCVLLDIGCGYGRLAKYLLKEIRLEGYVGLD